MPDGMQSVSAGHIAAGRSLTSTLGVTAPANTRSGFLNLINAMVGPTGAMPEPADSDLVLSVTSNIVTDGATRGASDAALAQSLIRSMLGASGLVAKGTDAKAPGAKNKTTAAQPNAMTVPGASLLVLSSLVSSPVTVQGQVASGLPVDDCARGTVTAVGQQNSPVRTRAPDPQSEPQIAATGQIAFEAQLSPLVPQATSSVAAEAKPEDPKSNGRLDFQTARTVVHEDRHEDTPVVLAVGPGTAADQFARAFDNAAPPPTSPTSTGDARAASTFGTVADTLRASETSNVAAPAATATSGVELRDISLRIARAENPVVDLRVIERGGEIHVTVRTPDAGLETLLRRDLDVLTNSLERAGYRTETYVPRAGHDVAELLSRSGNMDQQNRESQHESRQETSGRNGDGSSGRQDQRRQQSNQNRNQRTQNWTKEMEKQK